MKTTNFIQFGYMESYQSKYVYPLTQEKFHEIINSENISDTMCGIEMEMDEKKKIAQKEKLPVAMFACQLPENSVRPKLETAVASGLCIHDWDHMEEYPGDFYTKNISGHELEDGILLAHITPRGKGLRLVTTMHEGESITECQERLAKEYGMSKFMDRSIKDITRISFIPCNAYFLYESEELWKQPVPAETTAPKQGTGSQDEALKQGVTVETTVAKCDTGDNKIAQTFEFRGIKYSQIIEALLDRIATMGIPEEGERNRDLYLLSRELRHICNYNFDMMFMLVRSYFPGLPDDEVRRTLASAIGSAGKTLTPMMRGVLTQLENENIDETSDKMKQKMAKVPKLPPIMEMICKKFPVAFRNQVVLASLPLWGTIGTHVRFKFLDGRMNSLSFQTAIVAKSTRGKGFAAHLYNMMTAKFQEMDKEQRQMQMEYQEAYERTAQSKEKPKDPHAKVRLYGDDITTNMLLEYLYDLRGEHGLQFTEEIARLCKARRTQYGDNDDLYCKAFDNSMGGKESKSRNTRNIHIPIYLNTLFLGTPGAMHRFYNNPEGGLPSRVIFTDVPNIRVKGFLTYEDFTPEEQEQFDKVFDDLYKAGTGDDNNLVKLPFLEHAIELYKAKMDREDKENPDETWYDLGKRAMIYGFRAGVLAWLLWGRPEDKQTQSQIVKLVNWVADTARMGVYNFCGDEYDRLNDEDNSFARKVVTKNKKLYSLLPDEFTTKDVIATKARNGEEVKNPSNIIARWVADGLIQKITYGRYRKLKALVA